MQKKIHFFWNTEWDKTETKDFLGFSLALYRIKWIFNFYCSPIIEIYWNISSFQNQGPVLHLLPQLTVQTLYPGCIPQNRILELFKLEEIPKLCLVPLPYNEQGYLQVDQVLQKPVKPSLEHLQGQGIHFSGQHGPVPHYLCHKKIIL